MKTAKEILIEEIASRTGESFDKTERNFDESYKEDPDAQLFIDAMETYALQCCEDLRERIAESATYDTIDKGDMCYEVVIDKQSILDTEIILP